ncbi:predicted protein [Thalassiosira pseudonana CCMP1335]|uniref:EF-hand domain-containing protein n=1 Tax=Thalassiosira pseudonana TaxID=35128 RepID=B8CFG7_THAPS|nr:predicted protein [Thalassiosira pseudonana CCMP1335]EED87626.1 predicted protein [Thalassiosira pseudonana CCMP1335]
MKLSLKHVLLLTALAVATQPNLILASEDSAAVSSDAVADAAAEAKVEEAVEAAVDASTGDVVVEDDATDDDDGGGDAGKECAADDCSSDTIATVSETTDEAEAEEEDPKCPSRPHVIRCAAKYLDTNHNGALEREELESVMNSVPWLLRSLLKIIGSVDSIMKKCDADGDGIITIEDDMEATKETCLATCFKRSAFKKLFFPDCTE